MKLVSAIDVKKYLKMSFQVVLGYVSGFKIWFCKISKIHPIRLQVIYWAFFAPDQFTVGFLVHKYTVTE